MSALDEYMKKYGGGVEPAPVAAPTVDFSTIKPLAQAVTTTKAPSAVRRVGDFGVDVLKAVPTLVEAGAGLAGLVPGLHYAADPVGQFAGGVARGLGDKLYSAKRLEEEADIQRRTSAVADKPLLEQAKVAADAYTSNPYALLGAVGQSLGLAKGGAVAGTKLLSAVGKPVRAADGAVSVGRAATAAQVGEGLVAGGLVAANAAQENPEDFAARYYGVPAGALTTLISRGASKVLPGANDVDTLLAGGAATATGAGIGSTLKNVGLSAFREGVLEESLQSGQEQMFTNLSTNQPVLRGVGGAMAAGALTGSAMGGAFGFKKSKPAGQMSDDDIKAATDEVLNPQAAPAAEPLADELAQAQRAFEIQNQPQGQRFPALAASSNEELVRMQELLASDASAGVRDRESTLRAVTDELAFRARPPELTQGQRNDALIAAEEDRASRPDFALQPTPQGDPGVNRFPDAVFDDPQTTVETAQPGLFDSLGRALDPEPTLQADFAAAQVAQREGAARAARERGLVGEQAVRAASVTNASARAQDAADRLINQAEGRDLLGDLVPEAVQQANIASPRLQRLGELEQRAVEGTATPQERAEMSQLRDQLTPQAQPVTPASTATFVKQYPQLSRQVAKETTKVAPDQLVDWLAARIQKKGASSANYAPVLAQMYADLTGGQDIQQHEAFKTQQIIAGLQGFQEAPTQGRIENVQGVLTAVPRLTKQQQTKNARATAASAAVGASPAAPLGVNIEPAVPEVKNAPRTQVAGSRNEGTSNRPVPSPRADGSDLRNADRGRSGRTGAPAVSGASPVAVGATTSQPAPRVEPSAAPKVTPVETQVAETEQDIETDAAEELEGYKKDYTALTNTEKLPAEKFAQRKAEFLQMVAEVALVGETAAVRADAAAFVEAQKKDNPGVTAVAKRKAEAATKRTAASVNAEQAAVNKLARSLEDQWAQALEQMDEEQAGSKSTKRTKADRQIEKALKESGVVTEGLDDSRVHTMRSLAESLVATFGDDMKRAILSGRVRVVRDQTHLGAAVGSSSLRGKITQGLYAYSPKAGPGSGTVYFVAKHMAKDQQGYRAVDVALHEIGEHAGMEQFLRKGEYQKLLSSIRKAMADKNPTTQWGRDVATASGRLLPNQQGQPHEVLAYMIQHTPESSGLKKMWAAIKAFAARFGLLPGGLMDGTVMRALAEGATAKWLKGAGTSGAQRGTSSSESSINDPDMLRVLTDYRAATTAAKAAYTQAVSAESVADGSLKAFKLLTSWITKHHMVERYDKWFGGALAKNAAADTIQQATSARVSQLFSEPYNKFKALPAAQQETVSKIMELTEMRLDVRKPFDAHVHLKGLTATERALAKKHHDDGKQQWGRLSAEAKGVYTDLATMNEVLYTMEMAVSMYNIVHANAGPARQLPVFDADPTARFRQSANVHGSITAAQTYWSDVLDKYMGAVDTHVAQQRGLLPTKAATDPEVLKAERDMLKGIQSDKVRRTIRAQLRTRTDKMSDEQKKILRHLSPLEAQLRVAAETTETIKQAPYFHLGRFGDHIVSFRVRTGEDATQADPKAMAHVQAVLAKEFPDISIRSDATDPHVFARFESAGQAAAYWERAQQLQAEGWLMPAGFKDKNNKDLGAIQQFTRQDVIAGYHTAGPNWLARVVEGIQAEGFDDDVTKQMVASVRSMYLDALPDTASIKVKQRREGVPGWQKDMIRNYAHRMRVGANRAASLAAEPTRTQSFAEMNDVMAQASSNPKVAPAQHKKMAAIVSELQKRNSNQMTVPHTPGTDMLRAVNHAYFLGMSPSYLLIQMTQLGVLSWPELAKKHGFVDAAKALASVSGIALKVAKTVMSEGYKSRGFAGAADMTITGDVLEKAGLSKSDTEFLLKIMAAGKLDIGNAARNVGRVAEGETGSEALKIATAMGYASEVLTRTITALAAKKLHKGENAEAYAIKVIDEAMLDYTTENEGRMMGKQGVIGAASPVMFSFMKYQAQVLEKMYREVYNAYSAQATDKEKEEARKFLKGHLSAMMLLAGSLGMPFASAVAAAADKLCEVFGEGHCDSKIALRNMTAEVFGHDIEPLLSKGAASRVFGFDVSERAGEANILPFSKFLSDKRAMDERLKSLAMDSWGAPTSMIANMLVANEKMWQGDLLGAMQEGVPLALKGPIKAYKLSEAGYTDKAGNVLPMTPGAYDMLLQTIGLVPGELADYQQAKFAQSQRAGVLGREATKIRQKLATAIEQEDSDGVQKWLAEAQTYDAENGGSRAILPSMGATLRQRAAARAQAQTTGTTLGVKPQDIGAQQFTSFLQ